MLRVYYYYFKILFPFPSRPSCCHDPPGGLCTEGETLRSRAVFHLAFSHGLNQAFQGTTESFQNCSGAGPSFVRGGWRYGGHQQNTVIVIPNRERVRDVWEAQCLASKLGGGTLFIQVHVFSQTGDGRKVLLRNNLFLVEFNQQSSFLSQPTVSAICTPSNAAGIFFFFL